MSTHESSSESDNDDQEPSDMTFPESNQSAGLKLSLPAQAQHCVILLRGVVWKSEEVKVMNLWQNLLRFWPVTLADTLVTPAGVLQAHGGIPPQCKACCCRSQHWCSLLM